ncbi:unnamed protein product, partial [Closterium sp. Naga37s-1]
MRQVQGQQHIATSRSRTNCATFNVNRLLSLLVPVAVKALVQLKEAWGMWAGNSNATTACSAWTGVTCSPKGLVVALDAKLFSDADPPPSGAIPASITSLATLQYLSVTIHPPSPSTAFILHAPCPSSVCHSQPSIACSFAFNPLPRPFPAPTSDLTYIDLVGSIPSLATLTSLTHLYVLLSHGSRPGAIGVDGSRLAGSLEGLAWLSSLTNLKTLGLEYLAAFTGDFSSLHILSHLGSLEKLNLLSLTNATGEIPREIRYLTTLTALDVSFLRAVEFPDWVTHLTNLQYLNVDTDDPRRQGLLKDDMSELTALTTL